MTDPVLRRATTALALGAVAAAAGCKLPDDADPTLLIVALAQLGTARPGELAVATGDAALDALRETTASVCLVSPGLSGEVPAGTIALVSADPSGAFLRVAALVDPESLRPRRWAALGTSPATAFVHAEARLEPGVALGPGAVVGAGAEIGAGTAIGAGTVVDANVRIGRGCAIDAHVTLSHSLIGDRVVIHAGARIGVLEPGAPRLGRAILQDDVEIGSNAVVMRGGMADTIVGEGAIVGTAAVVSTDEVVARCTKVDRAQSSARV